MKPDLRGVRQWGPGKYTDLRSQQELPRRKRRGQAYQEALKSNPNRVHRTMISLEPELIEFARSYGKNRLSSGIRNILRMVQVSGAKPNQIETHSSGSAYHALNLRLTLLEKQVKFLLRSTRAPISIDFSHPPQPRSNGSTSK